MNKQNIKKAGVLLAACLLVAALALLAIAGLRAKYVTTVDLTGAVRFTADLAVDVTACQPEEQPICRGVLAPESKSICQRQFSGETYQVTSIQEKPFTFTEDEIVPMKYEYL